MRAFREPAPVELEAVLTAAQREAVLTACSHLHPLQANALLRGLAWWLRGRTEVGSGELHRIVASLMREQMSAPAENGHAGPEAEAPRRRRGTHWVR
jgi:hypothetical protein